MKKTHYKSITMTFGLICLMIVAVLLIALATQLAKGTAVFAKIVGIFIIASGACLSLSSATTILDRPKESVPNSYRKLIIGIVIATGALVLLWLIVLFATNPGLIVRYLVGKRFEYGSGKEFETFEAALLEAEKMKDKVSSHLIITQITIALTIVVAYFNLIVTRRFIFKNRMIPIQVLLYVGAFLFYVYLLLFTISAHAIVNSTDYENYVRVVINPTDTMAFLINPVGVFIAFSGLAIYIIATVSSIWSVRRFKHEGLYDERAITNNDNKAVETKVETSNDKDDIKSRIQKLNELHDQGLISDEEYEKKKKDIIDSI